MNKEEKDNIAWMVEILASAKRMLVAERDRVDHSHQAAIRAIIAQVDAAKVIALEVADLTTNK